MQSNPDTSGAPLSPETFHSVKARHLIGFWFLFQIIGGIIGGILGLTVQTLTQEIGAYDPIWTLIGGYLGWGLFLKWALSYLKKHDISVAKIIGSFDLTSRDIWQSTLVAVGCLTFSMGAGILMFNLLDQLAPQVSEAMQDMMLIQTSEVPFLQNLLLTGLLVAIAPTLEEFLFRGLLLHRWAFKWNLVRALIISSLLFGFAHINPVGLTLFGVMMSLLYLKTNKLAAPVLAHGINNGIVAIFVWVPQSDPSPASNGTFATGIFCLVLALPLLSWLAYSLWTQRKAVLPYES
ncbi:MAG: type II CAAX endopeptidase family protein [Leptolyngbyaceae bacterium]|nr:type II CAAX endopeptidase family protein [Leptolyngbyaceae bacterium]